jgi:hypothetical protein
LPFVLLFENSLIKFISPFIIWIVVLVFNFWALHIFCILILVWSVPGKDFVSFCRFSMCSDNCCFVYRSFLIWCNLICSFCSYFLSIGILFMKSWPMPMYSSVYPMFSYSNIKVSGHRIRSLIHVVMIRIQFQSFTCRYLFVEEAVSSLMYVFGFFVKNHIVLSFWVYFSGFYFIPCPTYLFLSQYHAFYCSVV